LSEVEEKQNYSGLFCSRRFGLFHTSPANLLLTKCSSGNFCISILPSWMDASAGSAESHMQWKNWSPDQECKQQRFDDPSAWHCEKIGSGEFMS
jgi:hypothetical protein